MKNVDFNEIKKILLERKLPDYDDFFEVLNEVTETLENEDESYRPKNDDEKCGSLIDFQSEDRLTLVVPDLHARPDFLLNILSADVRKIINKNESDFLFCENNRFEFDPILSKFSQFCAIAKTNVELIFSRFLQTIIQQEILFCQVNGI